MVARVVGQEFEERRPNDVIGVVGQVRFAALSIGFQYPEIHWLRAEFTTADIQTSKQIFAAQARSRAPLVRTICRALGASADGNLRAGFFLDLLARGFGPEDARQQLDTAIDWGRYGELFDYDTDTDEITADPAAGLFTPASA